MLGCIHVLLVCVAMKFDLCFKRYRILCGSPIYMKLVSRSRVYEVSCVRPVHGALASERNRVAMLFAILVIVDHWSHAMYITLCTTTFLLEESSRFFLCGRKGNNTDGNVCVRVVCRVFAAPWR